MEEFYFYSFFDINKLSSLQKKEFHQFYDATLQEWDQNRLIHHIILSHYGKSLYEIENLIQDQLLLHTSLSFFPNDVVLLYPSFPRVLKARTSTLCQISGSIIMKNSEYLYYRPILDNLSNGQTYVLTNSIKAELGYSDFFPSTIFEFEQLNDKLNNSYEVEDESYNYYDISQRIGEGLSIKKLKNLNNK